MTVAHVRTLPGAEFAEVMFLESARIYKLFKNNLKYEEIMKTLRKAAARNCSVRVLLNLPQGDVIEDVTGTG